MKKLNNEQREALLKTQNVLRRIENGDKFFFNLTVYTKNLGFVYAKNHYCEHLGNKVIKDTTYHLTESGKELLAVAL